MSYLLGSPKGWSRRTYSLLLIMVAVAVGFHLLTGLLPGHTAGNSIFDGASVKSKVLETEETSFLFLPGAGGEKAMVIFQRINRFASRLKALNRNVTVRVLDPISDEYVKVVRENALASFPSVVVIRQGGKAVALSGEILKYDLSRAFLAVATGCGPECGTKGHQEGSLF